MHNMKRSYPRVAIYTIMIVLGLCFLVPFYVLIITGFKPFAQVSLATMWQLPKSMDFHSYLEAFDKLSPNFLNSVYMAVPATLLAAIIGSMNAYVFSKWKFRGSEWVFTAVLFGMFIPYQSILIPLILTIQKIGLYNSIPGLVLTHTVYGIPVTTLMFRNFYANIPTSMIESAKMDGAGFLGIYRHFIIPLSTNGFVVVVIWEFTQIWNEFLFAVTIAGYQHYPIMVALENLAGSQIVQWNVQMAGSLLAALPTMLVYIFAGRQFIRGLYAGSVKG